MRKRTTGSLENFGELVGKTFPPVKFAFGYGSAFFQQKNYDYEKHKPIFDVIMVVEDREEWHAENLKMNRNHYGGLSYIFGAGFINFTQNLLCPIHYNPFVMLDEFKIKYGVISERDFKRDLLAWETLIVSGRMHKPVKAITQNEEYSSIINRNLQSAVATSLLLDGRSVISDKELFLNIASLSYLGDIRFALKGENKDKIVNIVEGQYTNLQELYNPILNEAPFKDILTIQDGILFPKFTTENRHALIELLPSNVGAEYVGEGKDFKKSIQIRKDEQREILRESLETLNSRNSRNMLFYHLLTVSPLKNFQYAMSKLAKGFAKKK